MPIIKKLAFQNIEKNIVAKINYVFKMLCLSKSNE